MQDTLRDINDNEILCDDQRARVWISIVYPDSAPVNWREYLDDLCVPIAISPCHAEEIGSDGRNEKPHYHVIYNFGGVKSYKQMINIVAPLHGTRPMICNDIRAQTRYLVHLDHPKKRQYDRSEITPLNGFDLETNLMPSKAYIEQMTRAIEEYINKYDIREYADLIVSISDEQPAWRDIIINQRFSHFKLYLASQRAKAKEKASFVIMEKQYTEVTQKQQAVINDLKDKLEKLQKDFEKK